LNGRVGKEPDFLRHDNLNRQLNDNIDKVVEHLEKDSFALIEWFSCNEMKANPDQFQALAIGSAMKVDRS
jgi:hypothetical protein